VNKMFSNEIVHKDGSFVKMSSKDVKVKCEATLRSIKQIRQQKVSKTIEDARQEIMGGFLYRLFKRPPPTDEEVRDYLHGDWISPLFWDERAFYKDEEVATKLLHACQFVEEIYVSTEDLRRIT
jgi:hypothetical protein